jgi:hypothetical protein
MAEILTQPPFEETFSQALGPQVEMDETLREHLLMYQKSIADSVEMFPIKVDPRRHKFLGNLFGLKPWELKEAWIAGYFWELFAPVQYQDKTMLVSNASLLNFAAFALNQSGIFTPNGTEKVYLESLPTIEHRRYHLTDCAQELRTLLGKSILATGIKDPHPRVTRRGVK